ncbi:MAG: hypothetical protein ACRYF4_05685 [Janthinobacterium lividum]
MSRLTCSQCEGMLLDAADGLLLPDEQTHFDLHMAECASCPRLLADVRRGGAWMEMLKEAPPVPPADMVDRILAMTSGNAVEANGVMAQAAHAASLFGDSGAKILPFRVPPHLQQPRTRYARMVHTVMQPRFAMTAAMAFFSIALTMNIAGVRLSSLRASDLKPVNLRKSFWAVNNRAVRYYDNLRVVYELESRVREMQRENDSDSAPRRGILAAPQPKEIAPSRQPPTAPPRSSTPKARDKAAAAQSEARDYRIVPVEQNTETAATAPRGEGEQA